MTRFGLILAAWFLAAAYAPPGSDPGSSRYSDLAQITPENVSRLGPAWTYSTGDLAARPDLVAGWKFQATPILVEGRLIVCTPRNEVIGLDPGTGEQVWRHDPGIADADYAPNDRNCRGVAPWTDASAAVGAQCRTRVFTATIDGRLLALDASTGAPCPGFGQGGAVRIAADIDPEQAKELTFPSAPAVARNVVLVGSAIPDGQKVAALSGKVRAFDARTGAALWSFDPIPRSPDDPRAATWGEGSAQISGAANVWAPISADEARGVFYVPTGSASPDYYGGTRPGDNRDANSVVALEAETGRRLWAFQTVRHDVWDYDVSAPPTLIQVIREGRAIDAIAQVTKMGFIFTLNRDTGEPLFPVVDRPTPQGGIEGEQLSPTQPAPTLPAPLVPEEVKPFGLTPWDRGACEDLVGSLRHEGLFTPPSLQGTIVHPFSGGGANWGGAAFHPGRGVLVVNTSDAAEFARQIPRAEAETAEFAGRRFPQDGSPYVLDRGLVRSPLGAPCTDPPWGKLHAIDMNTGQELWNRPLGAFEDLIPFGDLILPKGTPNLGGPLVTESGVIFIGATMDDYLRAFDLASGEELWKGRLPGGGQATPMTYEWDGVQYVVIAAGGHGLMGTTPNDTLVAFALPPRGAAPGPFTWWNHPTPRASAIAGGVLLFLIVGLGLLLRLRRKRS